MTLKDIKPSAISRKIQIKFLGNITHHAGDDIKRRQAAVIETVDAAWKLWELIISKGLVAQVKARHPKSFNSVGISIAESDNVIWVHITRTDIAIEAWLHHLCLIPRNIVIDPILLNLDVPPKTLFSERQRIYKEFICEIIKDLIDRPSQLEGESKNVRELEKHRLRSQTL